MVEERKPGKSLEALARERLEAARRVREEARIAPAWAPERPGAMLVGAFLGAAEPEVDGESRLVWRIKDAETGELRSLWAGASLEPQMRAAMADGLRPGEIVAVSYDGETKTKRGRTCKVYTLARLDDVPGDGSKVPF
jgi:hypothetical protein